ITPPGPPRLRPGPETRADPGIDFKPFATPGSAAVAEGSSTSVTLAGQAGYPDAAAPGTLSYAIVTPPSHGTVTNFNAATGQFDYTPAPGYSGPDSLQFQVQENGPAPPLGYSYFDNQYHNGPATTTTSNPATVTFNVTPTPTTPNPTPTPPNPTPTSSPTPTPTPPPPPVTVVGIVDMTNRRHRVTGLAVTFSGALDFASANNTANYELIKQGKHHKFLVNRHAMIAIASASYDPALNRVTLVPRKPFVPGKPVEIVVLGGPGTGVYDAEGRLIEGNATGIITRRGVTLG
ncbi:MAG: Ig-like domain-containing protein, partial [Isosphaeraceae bacterium]